MGRGMITWKQLFQEPQVHPKTLALAFIALGIPVIGGVISHQLNQKLDQDRTMLVNQSAIQANQAWIINQLKGTYTRREAKEAQAQIEDQIHNNDTALRALQSRVSAFEVRLGK